MNAPTAVGGGGQVPSNSGLPGAGGQASAYGAMEMLTPTEGVDFNDYLHRVYITVKRNWFSVMPESVRLGDKGVVSLQFQIMRNGSVPDGEPVRVVGSGKEPLDRAAVSSIRASNPFEPLPPQFQRALSSNCVLRTTIIYSQSTRTSETRSPTSSRQSSPRLICAYLSVRPRTPSLLSMNREQSALPLVAIVGPTASGKSAFGVWLAERLGGEVVACDSTQLYAVLT